MFLVFPHEELLTRNVWFTNCLRITRCTLTEESRREYVLHGLEGLDHEHSKVSFILYIAYVNNVYGGIPLGRLIPVNLPQHLF